MYLKDYACDRLKICAYMNRKSNFVFTDAHEKHGASVLLSQPDRGCSACNHDVLRQGSAEIQQDSGNLTAHRLPPAQAPETLGWAVGLF